MLRFSPLRALLLTFTVALVLAAGAAPAQAADGPRKIRIATLAPKASAWGKVFKKWSRRLKRKTNGQLQLRVYYNGVMGDEKSMVAKMKSGQLDAAALSSVGLSRIHKNVMVLQMPGVLDSWKLLDRARRRLGPDIKSAFAKKGFTLLGWGDIGRVRQMSKGFAVRGPSDLKGKRPAMWKDEPMGPVVYQEIGVRPIPVGVAEVLPFLQSGKINVLSAPPLAAEALQWTPRLDHIGSDSTVCAIGGSVIRTSVLDDMPADLKKTFTKIQKRYQKRSRKRIRKLDAKAYRRLKRRMTVVKLSKAERAEWKKVLTASIEQFAQGTFPRPLVERVLKISGKK